MLMDCPVTRMVLKVPDAIPYCLFSTDFIIADWFGDEKNPMPTPNMS